MTHRPTSWIVIRRSTDEAVLETWNADVAAHVDRSRFEVLDAQTYLGQLNRHIRASSGGAPQ